jgi:hypothetical protein
MDGYKKPDVVNAIDLCTIADGTMLTMRPWLTCAIHSEQVYTKVATMFLYSNIATRESETYTCI